MRWKGALVALVAAVGLAGCGGGGDDYSPAQKQKAEDFCASEGEYVFQGMGIDKYENPEGYKQCVKDAVKVTDCLDTPAKALDPWVPPNCDNNGYK